MNTRFFLLLCVLAATVAYCSGCWTIHYPSKPDPATNGPSAWDIHNQFANDNGNGFLMATNRSVKP